MRPPLTAGPVASGTAGSQAHGATLWAHDHAGRGPRRITHTVVAIPWDAGAQVAEAIGCRAALYLLLDLPTANKSARIVGDNLAVVRFGAGTARLRRVAMQAQVERGLNAVLGQGWRLAWQAVRRRLNGDADCFATQGVMLAARLRDAGQYDLNTTVTFEEGYPQRPGP